MQNNVYFISDLHFTHLNAMYYRPKRCESVGISLDELRSGDKQEVADKHDKWLINLWNSRIHKYDTVYILGDFCLGNKIRTEYILNRLHGKKFLIRGNHDKSCNGLERYFVQVSDIKEAKFTNSEFPFINKEETFCVEMCHFPLLTWNRKSHGTVHIHGHSHGDIDDLNTESKELRVDVGLDANLANYDFISLETLYNYFVSLIQSEGCNTFQEYAIKRNIK